MHTITDRGHFDKLRALDEHVCVLDDRGAAGMTNTYVRVNNRINIITRKAARAHDVI